MLTLQWNLAKKPWQNVVCIDVSLIYLETYKLTFQSFHMMFDIVLNIILGMGIFGLHQSLIRLMAFMSLVFFTPLTSTGS